MLRNLIVILLGCCCMVACHEKQAPEKVIRPVKTMTVGQPQQATMRYFPGTLNATKEANVSFQVSGQIIKFPVLEGDRVEKGQLLAQLDAEQYQEKVNSTQAEYIRARADYDRASKIVKQGYITRTEYDRKTAEYLKAKAAYNSAKRHFADTRLRAPFTGVISKKFVDNHEYVAVKQPIVLLQDLRHIDITIHVPENIIMNLRKGDKSSEPVVIFESLPNKSFPVKVKEYSLTAAPDTQTFKIVFTMPHPEKVNILPGMTATIKVALPDYKSGGKEFFNVSASAIFVDTNNNSYVWILNPQTMQVSRHAVSVTRLDNKQIHVTQGIKPGDIIVTAGVHYLQENEKVSLLKPKTTS